MFIALLLPAAGFIGTMFAAKKVATTVAGVTVATNTVIANRAVQNYRLGTNPTWQNKKHEIERAKEKKGEAADYGDLYYQRFTIEKGDLPPNLHFLAREWMLNLTETAQLLHNIRLHQVVNRKGEYYDRFKSLLKKTGNTVESYEELVALTHGGLPDFEYLTWVSDNRLSDKSFVAENEAKLALAQKERHS